jgi:uncharacterized protein GlcG (DUF336 family)
VNEAIARNLVEGAVEHARGIGVPITVAVVDTGGHVVMKLRMDGASLISVHMSEDKAWTAAAIGSPTGDLNPLVQAGESLFGLTDAVHGRIITFAGGLPVQRDGQLVGGIGISGGSTEQDGEVAERAVAAAASTA